MIKRSFFTVGVVALLAVMAAFPAWAVPGLINYQGKLTDSGGNSLNGDFSMTFLIYNTTIGGTTLWNESQSVQVIDGIYSVELGSVSPFPADLFDSAALYLEVIIGGETLSPRQRLTSTAFSMKAGDAETVAGLTPSEIAATSHSHSGSDITTGTVADARIAASIARDSEITWGNLSNIPSGFADGVDNTGGITTETDPTVLASVKDGVSWGEISSIPFGFADGVDNDTNTTYSAGTGLDLVGTQFRVEMPLILNGSTGTGTEIISVKNFGDGGGVHGYSESLWALHGVSDSGIGVYGHTVSGRGVLGHSNTDYGVYGNSYSGYGVHGKSDSGSGVYGYHANSGNYGFLGTYAYGVYGKSDSGYGVYGSESSSGHYGYLGSTGSGVYGWCGTPGGVGVRGYNADSGNHGFLGSPAAGVEGISTSHVGVYGESNTYYGVLGSSYSSIGVFARSWSNYAGYFSGPVAVTGYLTKSGGGFQIDHPLDPENKYLNHSFVESPDMMNIYNGNVVLDAKGERWVELPEWFGALNKDFRYQLTCIGGFAQVYISQEVSENRFKIAGGNSGMKVSWQVTGIRQDPWAEANVKPVEEDKAADELGFYLSPESYGQPEDKGIEWGRNPEMMQRMEEEREKSVESKEPSAG